MHGQQNVKFCSAKQATQIHKYKNIKAKLYKNNAAIWYNNTCRLKQITPRYINIKVYNFAYKICVLFFNFVFWRGYRPAVLRLCVCLFGRVRVGYICLRTVTSDGSFKFCNETSVSYSARNLLG